MELVSIISRSSAESLKFFARVTGPTSEPITLAQAQSWLRVDSSDDADEITALISAAREMVENATGRALLPQTWKLTRNDWPENDRIELPVSPLTAVSTVKYYPADGGAQATLDSSTYHVIAGREPGFVAIKDGESWPNLAVRPDAVEVTFTCGFADSASVPATLIHAVRLVLVHLYEQRAPSTGGSVNEMPYSLRHLLESQRVGGWIA